MGSDCCASPPVEAAPAVTPQPGRCRDLCCVDSDKTILAADNDLDKDMDAAPDCCAGKPGPCCDTSCLDRLAMRECAGGPDTCRGVVDGKACSQHSLSILDRYSVTLETLGCICRALIALGEETCCDIRDRHSPCAGSGGLAISSPGFSRSSETFGSSSSVTKERVAQNRLRLRGKGSGDSAFRPAVVMSMLATRKGKEKEYPCSEASGCTSGGGSCCSKPVAAEKGWAAGCCEKLPDNKAACGHACEKPVAKALNFAGSCAELKPAEESRVDSCCEKPAAWEACVESCSEEPKNAARSCADACCDAPVRKMSSRTAMSCEQPAVDNSCADSCCDSLLADKSCADACCKEPVVAAESCADSCCDFPKTVEHDGNMAIEAIPDIEDQGLGKERVILSISGMTCTGCETKLSRTLASVPAVKDLKTSLVLSRAEFNIDLRLGTVAEVIKHLERTTEFKCERMQNQGSSLDLIISTDPSKFIDQAWPDGVMDMVVIDKQTVCATFDPKIVGARDLAERSWGEPFGLAPPRGDASLEAGSKHVKHIGWMTLLSAILTIPVLVLAWAPLPKREVAYSSASLALATIVQVVIGGPFYPKALKALVFSRVIEMDLLIVLSTSAAYAFSVVSFGYLIAGKPLSTGQFFETSTLLVTLIMVGRWVAALARQRAVDSISMESLQSPTAILLVNGTEREIDVRLLQYGDVFRVLPDSRIPTDGTVISGSSEADESMLTGESKPVEKYPKSAVIAGSINGPGVLTVRLNRLPCDNTINTIADMVNEAKLSKPKLQNLADQVACYFVPVVVALTIVTFVIWVALGTTTRHQNGSEATIQAVTYAITVLIVSCPCAIGLAVPMVIVIASGAAAKKGIIFKSADAIEVAYKTRHVVFDKTGTLTRGKLSVTAEQCLGESKLPLLLGLVQNSRHPVSIAVATHLETKGITAAAVPEPKSLTGKGVETVAGGQRLQAAAYSLEDELRPDAATTVEALKKRNISVHLVSGDDDGAVQACASKLGIPVSNVVSRSSPAGKGDYVKKLDSVIFCGDGTNDAVALAQATIGVHINQGADVAQAAADVVLVRPHLDGILAMMNVSRKSVNRIWFNFAWSALYNTFAVLLAAGAFINARIPPEFAGLGELVSVLPVIAAAVLLRWADI
ncbi:ATPase, P-type, K/Mg/Cd/Cu/Zn/Na/Ca/Na/H-transporter [Akanthomyces lecanii RCEF 1005]|uniref:ATPase, P-type, K/Mg/Cd/Cu/Zn/Na/Ca/Na/H-transporter n=1 Tax=Akanthomyces lecanii RCEF 1005 TaxID=1081108 RepID=A0A168EYA2_CORDF|nr:ATPase, P-type, K/Mg/Cd/Cu/Zn/Na/Ca/Na/H-transporter [Akanthomyces lecanii RCEF 1005]